MLKGDLLQSFRVFSLRSSLFSGTLALWPLFASELLSPQLKDFAGLCLGFPALILWPAHFLKALVEGIHRLHLIYFLSFSDHCPLPDIRFMMSYKPISYKFLSFVCLLEGKDYFRQEGKFDLFLLLYLGWKQKSLILSKLFLILVILKTRNYIYFCSF